MSLHPVTVTFPCTINDLMQVRRMKELGQQIQMLNKGSQVLSRFGITTLSVSKPKSRSCHIGFVYGSENTKATAEGEVFTKKGKLFVVIHDKSGLVRRHFDTKGKTVKEFLEETFKPIFAPKATDKPQPRKDVKHTDEHLSTGFRHNHSTNGDDERAVNDNNGILTNAQGEPLVLQG